MGKDDQRLEFDSRDVAAYIRFRCVSRGIKPNHTLIQKILYCCYGVVLALTEKRLTWEHPQAWPYGPVFPHVFTEYRRNGLTQENPIGFYKTLSNELQIRIDQTIDFFSRYKAWQLSAWTHMKGTPWYEVSLGGTQVPMQMEDGQIYDYFRNHVLKKEASLNTPANEHIMR